MTKTIMILAIAAAFVAGTLMANPVVEAAGGWKAAVDDLQLQITNIAAGSANTISTYHVTQGAIFSPTSNQLIMTQTFTMENSGHVSITANVIGLADNDSDALRTTMTLSTPNIQVRSLQNIDTGEFGHVGMSWTGAVPAGTHTVNVQMNGSILGQVCSQFSCQLDILVIETP